MTTGLHAAELLWVWTTREIRVRYKQSVLGVAWAVLQPLSLMLVYTLVFSRIVRIPTGDIPYPLFSYAGVLPWTFFASSISLGVPSLVNNMNLITKVKMPREIMPVGAVLAGLLDFAVAGVVFVGILWYYGIQMHWTVLWVVPLVVLQVVLSIAVVLFGAALNALYRDVRFIVPLATQIWMYATPIIYPAAMVPERYQLVYNLNPMAVVVESYRLVIIDGVPPDGGSLLVACLIACVFLCVGYLTFKQIEPVLADII